LWANKLTLETNLIAALVQIEVALQMFNDAGSGHLVLISSVLGARGVPGVRAAYAASKAGLTSLGESLNAEYASNSINITTIEPGYIQSEMTAKADNIRLTTGWCYARLIRSQIPPSTAASIARAPTTSSQYR
jgi:NAD(P)-dependent dehydrogenase (short-subunit alcohol dehydrogenase family)